MQRHDILIIFRQFRRLYDAMNDEICEKHCVTRLETDIAACLSNNAELDTASDIVEYRMLLKSNVSPAVESLIKKGFLTRERDENDRRKIHLKLTEKADALIHDIRVMQDGFGGELFCGFSESERNVFSDLLNKMALNAENVMMKGGK